MCQGLSQARGVVLKIRGGDKPAPGATSAHTGHQIGRTPGQAREQSEWQALKASGKAGLWNE